MTRPAPTRRTSRFAYTSRGRTVDRARLRFPYPVTRDWAWGGSTGAGVRVCVIDSGLNPRHPKIGDRTERYRVATDDSGRWVVEPDDQDDLAGHGTACAGIIRSLAPDCDLVGVRVLGAGLRGKGEALLSALEWATAQRFAVVNLSLSTRRPSLRSRLRELTDEAYRAGVTIVSSAPNRPANSYPWRFPSVISVGSHGRDDPEYLEVSPAPPIDFFAAGVGISVAWLDGATKSVSGNSFATPHVAGMCARILQPHPTFRTAQLKHVLAAIADNVT